MFGTTIRPPAAYEADDTNAVGVQRSFLPEQIPCDHKSKKAAAQRTPQQNSTPLPRRFAIRKEPYQAAEHRLVLRTEGHLARGVDFDALVTSLQGGVDAPLNSGQPIIVPAEYRVLSFYNEEYEEIVNSGKDSSEE